MKKILAVLLCLMFVGLYACGDPASDLTEGTTTIAPMETTAAQEDEVAGEEAYMPSYAVNATHFFAVLDDGELYYAPLDGSQRPKRIPLPLRYEGESLAWEPSDYREAQKFDTRICEVAEDSLVVGRRLDRDDNSDSWAMIRVSLDTFTFEPMGISEEATAIAVEKIEGNSVVSGDYTYSLETEEPSEDSPHWVSAAVRLYKVKSNGEGKTVPVYEWLGEERHAADSYAGLWRVGDIIVAESIRSGAFLIFNTALDKPLFERNWIGDFTFWDEWETASPPDYEIYSDYVLTLTHIYAVRSGELYKMPLNNIAKQEKIALPNKRGSVALKYVGIVGFTEQYIYVCRSGDAKDEDNYDYNATRVTYRVSLKTLQAEFLDEYDSAYLPRYNPEGNSLLYIQQKLPGRYSWEGNRYWVESFQLDDGKRSKLFDFSDYRSTIESSIDGWYNAPDGTIALDIWNGWASGFATYVAFGKDNAVRLVDGSAIPRIDRQQEETSQEPAPRNKAEESLAACVHGEEHGDIYVTTYQTYEGYTYYVECEESKDDNYGTESTYNFYRMKTNGTGKELLRAKTNIFSLMVYGSQLHCLAWRPNNGESYGLYVLDTDGKVTKTIAHGYDGEWGGTGIERMGDLVAFKSYNHWTSENGLICLYDPATGAVFMAQDKE